MKVQIFYFRNFHGCFCGGGNEFFNHNLSKGLRPLINNVY